MGEEKKITITGVDSILIDYEFARGPVITPGAFTPDSDSGAGERDIARSRKIVQVMVHNADGRLLADEYIESTLSAEIDIDVGGSHIIIKDNQAADGEARVSIQYPRTGYRSDKSGLYSRDIHIQGVRIKAHNSVNQDPVINKEITISDHKGTIEVYYRQKMPGTGAQSY